jgi:hypothetical protein
MKRFLRWLETKFSGPTNSVASNQIGDTASVEAGDVSTTSGADVPGRSGTVGTRKGISMPNIYTDSDVATEPDLKILEQPSTAADEPAGFNPYDTGVLQKK